ncbi:CcmD family protein [Chryseolinea sp. T2]|uniref:CcmD family protein n=1 Tax=Chryseolinea sp. T2 TaxID=3129255 RepID=UPI003076ACC7
MQSKLKYLFSIITLTCASFASQAQESVEMADAMRSNGKIYVVVGVILVIIAGLFTYLFSLDKKVTRIEKNLEKGSKTK